MIWLVKIMSASVLMLIDCRALQCRWLIMHLLERCCKWLLDSQLQTAGWLKLSYTSASWCKPWETTNCCSLCTLSLQMPAAWPYVFQLFVVAIWKITLHKRITAHCDSWLLCAIQILLISYLQVSTVADGTTQWAASFPSCCMQR